MILWLKGGALRFPETGVHVFSL
uniref:Uncharacterized protein n=1 Tax=Arundo donax TaxID=35708 RepID=A0A0A8Z687_ARUDO